jgi:hypothetical protein
MLTALGKPSENSMSKMKSRKVKMVMRIRILRWVSMKQRTDTASLAAPEVRPRTSVSRRLENMLAAFVRPMDLPQFILVWVGVGSGT